MTRMTRMTRMIRLFVIIGIFCASLAGCGTSGGPARPAGSGNQSSPNGGGSPLLHTVAYLDGKPITFIDLQAPLFDAAGGLVLAELILDRRVERRLAEKGLTLPDAKIAAERDILLRNLSSDENTAARLLRELRQRRGLGDARFDRLLRRNAGLRVLIQDDVNLTDAAVQQAFDIENGRRYEARLITVETLQRAGEVVKRARAGESFIDLAVTFSTDSSRAAGGLLPLLSPADPTWPDGVRKMLITMTPGQISDPVVIERGFAVLRLERKLEPKPVKFDDVKADLAERVRRSAERVLMQRLARNLLNDADLLVADKALRESWVLQKELMVE